MHFGRKRSHLRKTILLDVGLLRKHALIDCSLSCELQFERSLEVIKIKGNVLEANEKEVPSAGHEIVR